MATDQLTPTTRPAAAPPSFGSRVRRFRIDERYLPVLGTVVVLIAMLAIGGSRYENFLTGRVIANVLINNSFLVVIAVGMTFVILTGGIDLSVGAVVALSGCVAAWLFTHGFGAAVAIPLVILVGTIIGLVVGVMVHVFEIQPFIATLAAMFLARGLCYIVAPESIPITDPTIVALARTRWGTDDGLVIHPRLLGGGTWHTYADHRMAQAGALIGLVVEDVVIDDVACTDKTMPEFVGLWTGMLAQAADESTAEIAADPDADPL
jgi:simple sugar transport system permease protein